MTSGAFPIPQGTLEQGLISSALSSQENWAELKRHISSEDFTAAKAIFQFCEQYLTEYRNLPSSQLISSRFDWHPPLGEFQYWLSEMRRYSLARKITETMQDAFKSVGEPERALSLLVDRLALIRSQDTTQIQAYDASAPERYERYLWRSQELFQKGKLIGLRTGMHILDDTRMGWTPGNLVGCFSRPHVGKTWWLLWQGVISWLDKRSVLLISGEIPTNQIGMRVDAIVGDQLDIPINYSNLIIGDPSEAENYQKVTEILGGSNRWWTYNSIDGKSIGLADISSLLRLHNPDLLLIDNISSLKSSAGQVWEQVRDISSGLKQLTTNYDIPGIMTHHAVNSAKGRRTEVENPGRGDDFIMPSLNDVADGDSFVRFCSDVISMCGDQYSPFITWYSLRKYRERGWQQQMPHRLALATNYKYGKIVDLSEKGYNPEAIGQEARRLLGLNDLNGQA